MRMSAYSENWHIWDGSMTEELNALKMQVSDSLHSGKKKKKAEKSGSAQWNSNSKDF